MLEALSPCVKHSKFEADCPPQSISKLSIVWIIIIQDNTKMTQRKKGLEDGKWMQVAQNI